jgi:hypothetical protein
VLLLSLFVAKKGVVCIVMGADRNINSIRVNGENIVSIVMNKSRLPMQDSSKIENAVFFMIMTGLSGDSLVKLILFDYKSY